MSARIGWTLAALGPWGLLLAHAGRVGGLLAAAEGSDPALAAWVALLWPALVLAVLRSERARHLWRRLDDPAARVGLLLVVALHGLAVFAPLVATHPPGAYADPVADRFLPPSSAHWMGTDMIGRDLYSRLVYGSRVSLAIGVLSVFLNFLLGSLVGATSGYFRGWIETVLMRFTDLMLAFPKVFLVLTLVALYDPSTWLIVLVLGGTGWMALARVIRGEVLRVSTMEYVEAARTLGLPAATVLVRHVLPAALAPVIAVAALRIGNTILVESFLSFLGLGVTDPMVSWGMLMRSGRETLLSAWWISTFPGLAILVTVIGYNLLGDGLRDAYDPRLSTLSRSAE